jgi:hypothetical protein
LASRARVNLIIVNCKTAAGDEAYGRSDGLNNRIEIGWDHDPRTQAHEVLHLFGLEDEGMTGARVGKPSPAQPLINNKVPHDDPYYTTITKIRQKDIDRILNKRWKDEEPGGAPHPKIDGTGTPTKEWLSQVRARIECNKRIKEFIKKHGRISSEQKQIIINDVFRELKLNK